MKRSSLAVVVACVSALASPLSGQALGPAFRVNTYTTGTQGASRIAMDSTGGFVIAWQDHFAIEAQSFAASGAPLGGVFRVDTTATAAPLSVSVAPAAAGSFVVVWEQLDGSYEGIFGQRFGTSGSPLGSQFRVNGITTGHEQRPTVSSDGAGNFFVTWDGDSLGTGPRGIFVRRFDSLGAPLSGELRVNVDPYVTVFGSSVFSNPHGDFVVVWDQETYGWAGQRFKAGGAPVGSQFQIANLNEGNVVGLALDASGAFLAVSQWNFPLTFTGWDVYARRFGADGTAIGASFRVNTYTSGDQDSPFVSRGSDGFLVTWSGVGPGAGAFGQFLGASGEAIGPEMSFSPGGLTTVGSDGGARFVVSWSADGGAGSGGDVFAQRLGPPAVPAGSELRINTITTGAQFGPRVGEDSSGNFVVVWTTYVDNGPQKKDVALQRFAASGTPLGGELRVNTTTSGYQVVTDVGVSANGGFVVVWGGDDGSYAGVFAQRFSAAGAALGGEFRVNASTTGDEIAGRAAMDSGGEFVVVWTSGYKAGDGSDAGVFAQRFASSGAPIAGTFRVNTATGNYQGQPAIAMAPGGGFVVAWTGPFAGYSSIYAQRFASGGAPVGGEFVVNASFIADAAGPAVGVDAQGNFAVTWRSADVGVGGRILARRFASTGVALTPEFQVNAYTTGQQANPAISMDPSGEFTITWNSRHDGFGDGIFAQRFTKDGVPEGEFQVNAYTTQYQVNAAVAVGKTWVVAWQSFGQDGSADGIFGQRFVPPCRSSDEDGNGVVNVSDVLYLINHLFAGGPAPKCGGDADGNGSINVSDVLYLINYLFAGGPPPV